MQKMQKNLSCERSRSSNGISWETGIDQVGTGMAQFLAGVAAVPRSLLNRLQPEIIAALFQELTPRSIDPSSWVSAVPRGDDGMFRSREANARLSLLLLLIATCWEGVRFQQVGGEGFFVRLLSDPDARVRHYTAVFLQQRLRQLFPQHFQRGLRKLVRQAQQQNDPNLLHSAYLQVSTLVDSQLMDVGL
jgi:hypothetical protein